MLKNIKFSDLIRETHFNNPGLNSNSEFSVEKYNLLRLAMRNRSLRSHDCKRNRCCWRGAAHRTESIMNLLEMGLRCKAGIPTYVRVLPHFDFLRRESQQSSQLF